MAAVAESGVVQQLFRAVLPASKAHGPGNAWSNLMRNVYRLGWSSLTRDFSVQAIQNSAFHDEKVKAVECILYVANQGELASFTSWTRDSSISVRVLPEIKSVKDFAQLPPGLLAIHRDEKFLVPGGRFNEIYGWDSFFIALGLLSSIRAEELMHHAEHFTSTVSILKHLTYQIMTFGKVHNANRSYFVNRSNPPFLTSLILEIDEIAREFPHLVFDATVRKQAVIAAGKEILEFWLHPSKTDLVTGLTRYGSSQHAALCLAVEEGHYDHIFKLAASTRGLDARVLVDKLKRGDWPEDDVEVWRLVANDLAVRESGHDTSERLVDCAASLCTADLNCLIFKSLSDMYTLTGESSWHELSQRRRALINKYLYDFPLGIFCDYDCDTRLKRKFISPAAVVYPMWSGVVECPQVIRKLRDSLVIYLEQRGGIVGSENCAIDPFSARRQWDWPFGWAPHQMLAWEGLRKSGFNDDARRICFRWVSLLTNYYETYGCVPEKVDVVNDEKNLDTGDNVEYGTQCNKPGEFFGWTCASLAFAHGRHFITSDDELCLNTPFVYSVERQLEILASLDKHGANTSGNCMTWSTIASTRSHDAACPAEKLFS